MPLKYLIDRDGTEHSVEDALAGSMREQFPTSFVELASRHREWEGVASVTQCLNGTRMEYLKILCDYAESVDGSAFRVLGTRGHGKLEQYEDRINNALAETYMSYGDLKGTCDLIEEQPDGSLWMVDYKTSGSFRVKKALGIYTEDEPVLTADGEQQYYKSGKKKGKLVTRKAIRRSPARRDLGEWQWQLNRYRLLAREAFGFDIDRMFIFVIVRDGGTASARQNGVTENTYMIEVPELDEQQVLSYFIEKSEALSGAVASYENAVYSGMTHEEALVAAMPEPCTPTEAWDGRRCERYCPVAQWCIGNGDNPYVSNGGNDAY